MAKTENFHTDRKATLIGETVTVEGQLKDISIEGVGVESPVKAKIGTRLQVAFEIPALEVFNNLTIYGVVTHIHNIEHGFYLGIEFELLTTKEREIIQDFINYKKRLHLLGQRHYKSSYE